MRASRLLVHHDVRQILQRPVRLAFVLLLAASAILSRGALAAGPQDHADLSAGQIAEFSVAATGRSLAAWNQYSYTERYENRRSDSNGQVKSEEVEVTKVAPVGGVRFERIVERNGHALSAQEQRASAEALEKAEA
jgi:hypothetical protein